MLAGTHAGDEPLLRPDVRLRTYRVGSRKLVESFPGERHLFDLAADSGELTDIAPCDPERAAALQEELAARCALLALPALDGTAAPTRVVQSSEEQPGASATGVLLSTQ